MVKEGTEFEVQDARTGDDITRSVLTQIIFEEEAKGQNLLPIKFLRQLIRFYGDSLQAFVPGYLDMSMESFTKNQGAMRDRIAEALGRRQPDDREHDAPESRSVRECGGDVLALRRRPRQDDGNGGGKADGERGRYPQAGNGSDAPPAFRAQPAEMKHPSRGLGLLLVVAAALGGCAGPMTARQAQMHAQAGLTRYCRDVQPCGAVRVTGAQHLKTGWLVDFDAPAAKYGVFVHDDWQTDVSVWNKPR